LQYYMMFDNEWFGGKNEIFKMFAFNTYCNC
jgi:hypothetical protein